MTLPEAIAEMGHAAGGIGDLSEPPCEFERRLFARVECLLDGRHDKCQLDVRAARFLSDAHESTPLIVDAAIDAYWAAHARPEPEPEWREVSREQLIDAVTRQHQIDRSRALAEMVFDNRTFRLRIVEYPLRLIIEEHTGGHDGN